MEKHLVCRRKMLKRSVIGLIALVAVPFGLWARSAVAAKAPKSNFRYQDHPNEGHECASCAAFLASAQTPEGDGSCLIVEGQISPHGWCMAFTKK